MYCSEGHAVPVLGAVSVEHDLRVRVRVQVAALRTGTAAGARRSFHARTSSDLFCSQIANGEDPFVVSQIMCILDSPQIFNSLRSRNM